MKFPALWRHDCMKDISTRAQEHFVKEYSLKVLHGVSALFGIRLTYCTWGMRMEGSNLTSGFVSK